MADASNDFGIDADEDNMAGEGEGGTSGFSGSNSEEADTGEEILDLGVVSGNAPDINLVDLPVLTADRLKKMLRPALL